MIMRIDTNIFGDKEYVAELYLPVASYGWSLEITYFCFME